MIWLDVDQKLGLKRERITQPINGIDNCKTTIKYRVSTIIKSRINDYQRDVDFFVVSKITGELPSQAIDINHFSMPSNFKLADPKFHETSKIDALIGAQYLAEATLPEKYSLGNNKPYMISTLFGWYVVGSMTTSAPTQHIQNIITLTSKLASSSSGKSANQVEEELACENHFQETFRRQEDGRYSLRLPFKKDVTLGESKIRALRCFQNTLVQFSKNSELKSAYQEFMKVYEEMGHMERVSEHTIEPSPHNSYYIPHHAVFKPDSTTTKIRVVFNGSAKTSTGISLNDALMVGPTIQRELLFIILRFTIPEFAFMCDIEKMYRQIWIDPVDRDFLRIFWMDEEGNTVIWRLCTVTYGTTCAPYQAVRCLEQVCEDDGDKFPLAVSLLKDCLVDNVMTGNNDLNQLREAKTQIVQLLAGAGMILRKFAANHPDLLQDVPQNDLEPLKTINGHENSVNALGLIWNPELDFFMFKIPNQLHYKSWTKRLVLAELNRLFDPAGWLGPVKLTGNLLMQQIWLRKLTWDETIPEDLQSSWLKWYQGLQLLNEIKKSRRVIKTSETEKLELLGFSDACLRSYGCAIYIKSTDEFGKTYMELLCSQSRVAPQTNKKRKHPITLPKLELAAAHLLAVLIHRVIPELAIKFDNIQLFSDSQIVLCWIQKDPENFTRYAANRIREIQQFTSQYTWFYIESSNNPADIISRGLHPHQIVSNDNWWHAKSFLTKEDDEVCLKIQIPQKFEFTVNTVTESPPVDIQKYSSYTKLIRIYAWILRFIQKCRKFQVTSANSKRLSLTEMMESEKLLIKCVQAEVFNRDIKDLQSQGQVSPKSRLINLNPFLDDGILRVGGRLHHAPLTFNQKHPILLPSKHHFTDLLVRFEHIKSLHGGIQLTLANLRLKYWPLHGRSTVKRVLRQCIKCFRAKPTTIHQIMGPLPAERLQPTRPFTVTCIDYAGPFQIHNRAVRPTGLVKIWVAVFVCSATKAVHLEPVSDLTTAAFINALKRFRSRRGKCVIINSDNATTFKGANKLLDTWEAFFSNRQVNEEIKELCIDQGITWKFIPVKSPSVGGLWEAAVKSFKYHLKRIAPDTNFNLEEFFTLLCLIESCLNSRPLMPLTESPDDMNCLTPGHFLLNESPSAFVEPDTEEVPYNRLKRYQRIQKLQQKFWKHWQKNYLNTLQQRYKWKIVKNELKIGDMVLLIEEGLPPTKWIMGRITEVSYGVDGHVRIVKVKLPNQKITQRSVHKICPLPCNENE